MSYLKSAIPPEKEREKYSKLYFIACCFPPFGRGNAITNSCVANFLAKNFSIDVVCMKLREGGLISYQKDASLEKEISPNINVHRVEASNWWGINTALYILGIFPCYFLNWAWSVWRKRNEIFIEKGVIFSVYPVFSDLILGYLVSRQKKMPLLVDFRDDFSGVMTSGWRCILKPFYRYIEEKVVREAGVVTVTTEELRQDIIGRYNLLPNRVVVVNNIVPLSQKSQSKEVSNEGRLFVIYAGAMSRVQQPEILLKAYNFLYSTDSRWQKRLSVQFYGPESPYFNLKIRRHLGVGCHFGGFLPQEEISAVIASSHIGFFSLSDPIYAYATPTKLFDYIESEVPIVACLPQGAARSMIEKLRIGLVADVGDVAGLARCLQRMVEDEQLRHSCRKRMSEIREQFRPENQVRIWHRLLLNMGLEEFSDSARSNPVDSAFTLCDT